MSMVKVNNRTFKFAVNVIRDIVRFSWFHFNAARDDWFGVIT